MSAGSAALLPGSSASERSARLDGGLNHRVGQGAHADRLAWLKPGAALPLGELLAGPGAGGAGQREEQIIEGAYLPGIVRRARPDEIEDDEETSRAQGVSGPPGQVTVGRPIEVVHGVGDEHE